MLHCPLQIPVVCTPHEHHWSSSYHHTQSPTLLQCTPPLSPLSHLTLQLAEHLHSNYKTAGQLHMERTVQLLAYKCSLDVSGCIPAGTLKLNAKIVPIIAMTFIIICIVKWKVQVRNSGTLYITQKEGCKVDDIHMQVSEYCSRVHIAIASSWCRD